MANVIWFSNFWNVHILCVWIRTRQNSHWQRTLHDDKQIDIWRSLALNFLNFIIIDQRVLIMQSILNLTNNICRTIWRTSRGNDIWYILFTQFKRTLFLHVSFNWIKRPDFVDHVILSGSTCTKQKIKSKYERELSYELVNLWQWIFTPFCSSWV